MLLLEGKELTARWTCSLGATALLLFLAAALLSGCFAGTAGLAIGLVALSEGESGHSDALPQVTEFRLEPLGSPDVIEVMFQLANDDAGRLDAAIQYVRLDAGSQPVGEPAVATPAAGSPKMEDLPADETIRFLWDAERDLGGGSDEVRIVLTPVEDGSPGKPFRSEPFRASNTPVRISRVNLSSSGEQITVSFELADRESDAANILEFALSLDGGPFLVVPPGLYADPRGFASSPEGVRGSFPFEVAKLRQIDVPEELRVISLPGYVGTLQARLLARDFPSEKEWGQDEGPDPAFKFDTNDPPTLTVQPILPEQLASGIVPIRYTLVDSQPENKASIEVKVDLGDGQGPRPANEFPSPLSEGTTHLSADRSEAVHVFLWDALSQARGDEDAIITLVARDRENSPESRQEVTCGFSWLERAGSIETGDTPAALASADFDGDGDVDVVVANSGSDTLTCLWGEPAGWRLPLAESSRETIRGVVNPVALASGLFNGSRKSPGLIAANESENTVTFLRRVDDRWETQEIGVGKAPAALSSGDFDRDGFDDVVVANSGSDNVSILGGGEGKLSPLGTVEVGVEPRALACGFFDDEGGGASLDLVVANHGSRTVTYLPGSRYGLAALDGPREITTGNNPIALMSAHLDGDQYADLVVANWGSRNVTFLRGGPAGPQRGFDIETGDNPVALSCADFDRDGDLDVAVAHDGANHLALLEGLPGGLDPAPVSIDIGGRSDALAVSDYDADGFPDIFAACGSSDTIVILRGGREGPVPVKKLAVGKRPEVLMCGDYSGDGVGDLLAANRDGASVTLLHGGAGGLAWMEDIPVGVAPRALAAGDFDGDSFDDAVSANEGGDSVSWLRGASGGLRSARDIPVGDEVTPTPDVNPGALVSGDFDGDESLDLVVSGTSQKVRYLRGGQGGLQPETLISIPAGSFFNRSTLLASGDFNRDGMLDVLVANGSSSNLSYIKGEAHGLVFLHEIKVFGPVASRDFTCLSTGDYDRDGRLDVVAAEEAAQDVTCVPECDAGEDCVEGLPMSGDMIPTGNAPCAFASADFDGDGFLDLAVANLESSDVAYLRGSKDGLTRAEGNIPVSGGPIALASADYDGDGLPDLAVACETSQDVTCLKGGPRGLLPQAAGSRIRLGARPSALASADYDGDGFPDVVAALGDSSGVACLRGGTGGLSWAGRLPAGHQPAAVESGDYDGDGHADLTVANSGSNTVSDLRQRYLVPHPNRSIEQETTGASLVFEDPRAPCRYRLEIPQGAFSSPTQVCLVPGPVPALPQSEAVTDGEGEPRAAFLAAVTDPVSLLRESTRIQDAAPGLLTVRIRDEDPSLIDAVRAKPTRLRLFPKEGGNVVDITGTAPEMKLEEDFEGGKGVTFPVTRFGLYLVAILRERPDTQ